MGAHFCRHHEIQLQEETLLLCRSLFQNIDLDHHQTIDVSEALLWWKDNYSVINARAMFEAVDMNHDGVITLEEWEKFWALVRNKGHTDEEIREEIENIKLKMSWTVFNGMPRLHSKENY